MTYVGMYTAQVSDIRLDPDQQNHCVKSVTVCRCSPSSRRVLHGSMLIADANYVYTMRAATCGCRSATCCSERVAALRLRRAALGPVASTTACAQLVRVHRLAQRACPECFVRSRAQSPLNLR